MPRRGGAKGRRRPPPSVLAPSSVVPGDPASGGGTVVVHEHVEDRLHNANKVRNKIKRNEVVRKIKKRRNAEKKVEKERRHKELKAQGLPLPVPKTIETTRTEDCTFVAADDPDVAADERTDEFAALLSRDDPPSVMLTTCPKPPKATHDFAEELARVLPHASYRVRKETTLVKEAVRYARDHGHTALCVINENRKEVNGLTVIHLPEGPTLCYDLSSVRLSRDIAGHGR